MARRRGQNEGSVYQRASDGFWIGCISLGWRPDGTRNRKTVSSLTKTGALEKLRALQAEAAQGTRAASETGKSATVGKLCHEWLETIVKPGRAHKTYELYEGLVRLRIVPHLGRVKLADLTPQKVQRFLAALEAEGVSADGVEKTRRYLRAAVNYGVKWGWCVRNVVVLTEAPPKPRTEPRRFTDNDARRILTALRGHEFEDIFTLQLYLGLRIGEVLGLCKGDIVRHPGSGKPYSVRITRQLRETSIVDEDGKPLFALAPLKTDKSRRSILLPRRASEIIEKAIERIELADEAGALPESLRVRQAREWGLLFRSPDAPGSMRAMRGEPLRQDRVRKSFYVALEAAQVPRVRTHDLRHLCATILLLDGIPLKAVQEILGHASATTTLNTYAHVLPATHAAAAATLDAALEDRA